MNRLRIACISSLVSLFLCAHQVSALTVQAVKGQVSLGEASADDEIALYGSWMFFPNQHLSPRQFLEDYQINGLHKGVFAEVGQSFQQSAPNDYSDNFGRATYVLRIEDLPDYQLGMWGARIYSSSKIFFFDENGNGLDKPVSENGAIDLGESGIAPSVTMPDLISIKTEPAKYHYILIQASNAFHSWGGLWTPPRIARFDAAYAYSQITPRMNQWIMGFSLFIFLYNISLFLRQRRDFGSLYLALGCLTLLIRSLTLNNLGVNWLNNSYWSHEVNFKITYLSYTVGIVMIIGFLHSMFPRSCSYRVFKLSALSQIPIYLAIIFLPVRVYYPYTITYLEMSVFSLTILVFFCATHAFIHKEKGALWSFLGSIIVAATIFNDLLESLGYTLLLQNLTGIGISVFMALQTQVIADRFAIAFRTSETLRMNLQEEVDRQTRQTKTILNSIRQAIFIVKDENLKISSTYSQHLRTLCGDIDPSNASLDSVLLDHSLMDEDRKARIRSTLFASIKAEPIVFDINRDNLPWEIRFSAQQREKILELEWTPIINKDGIISQILVGARDVTDFRENQAKAMEKDRVSKLIIEISQISEVTFSRFITIIRDYINESLSIVAEIREWNRETIRKVFINTHTIKGLARSIGLHSLSNASHLAEQEFHAQLERGLDWSPEKITQQCQAILEIINEYQDIAEKKLGWNPREHVIKIAARELELITITFLQLQKQGIFRDQPDVTHAFEKLLDMSFRSSSQLIKEAFSGVEAIARDLKKIPPRLAISGRDVHLTSDALIILHSVLTHLLRNSIDHGIEHADERIAKGKDPRGLIAIDILTDGRQFTISYTDDGQGLDLDTIRYRALNMSLICDRQSHAKNDIARLIFSSGLSTKDSVSDISGRGVGMDAVQTIVMAAGGSINIELLDLEQPLRYHQCRFRITLPQGYWLVYEPSKA